ncbi:MAG: helix-turn-helix transcriptional regulator [Lachnospira sp.]|nr:helix-turn-helix transcriptional regulator [Lachnospira sp.]
MERNLKQEAVAAATGLGKSTISNYENDEYFGDLLESDLKKIAKDIRDAYKKEIGSNTYLLNVYCNSISSYSTSKPLQ